MRFASTSLVLVAVLLIACSGREPSSANAGTIRPLDDPPVVDDDGVRREKIVLKDQDGVEHEFKLEVAADDPSRAKGLMDREKIDEHGGMIFLYPKADYRSYWMANCRVDIDIIFVDPKGVVTAAHKAKAEEPRRPDEPIWRYELRLERYKSRRPAQFAIELKSGWIEKLGVKPGDQLDLDLERLKKIAEEADRDRWY